MYEARTSVFQKYTRRGQASSRNVRGEDKRLAEIYDARTSVLQKYADHQVLVISAIRIRYQFTMLVSSRYGLKYTLCTSTP
jgi:hypothetical protein